MRNPLANIAASPKENLMVRPVAANVVRISVDQMPLLLRRLEGVLAKERLYAQSPHVRSQEMSGPSSDAARGPSLTHNGLLLPARYTTLADLFLTPSVEQLSRYGAVS
jgi:hypothetical protein